jgi:hypothetical protein
MRAIGLTLLAASFALAAPLPGEKGTPEFEKATVLVKQLGHARFAVRETAAKELVEMGGAAVPALQAGIKSEDEEVRTRSTALLPQAKAADWKRRADAYLADIEGKQKHDLPLLTDWEKLIGKPDAGSRKLFAEMIRTKGEFLATVAGDRKAGQTATATECRLALDRLRGPKGQVKAETGELAAILLADAIAPPKMPDWSPAGFPAMLLDNPSVPDALDATETGAAFRRLIVRWMDARPPRDQAGCQHFSALVRKKPFPEAGPILAKWAKDKKADALSVRLLAIEALGKVGGKEAGDTLAGLIDDTTQVFGGGQDQYHLGDSALAALVQMKGKKLPDYGLNNTIGIGFASAPGDEPIMLSLHGFNGQDARKTAIEKWKADAAKEEPKKK